MNDHTAQYIKSLINGTPDLNKFCREVLNLQEEYEVSVPDEGAFDALQRRARYVRRTCALYQCAYPAFRVNSKEDAAELGRLFRFHVFPEMLQLEPGMAERLFLADYEHLPEFSEKDLEYLREALPRIVSDEAYLIDKEGGIQNQRVAAAGPQLHRFYSDFVDEFKARFDYLRTNPSEQ